MTLTKVETRGRVETMPREAESRESSVALRSADGGWERLNISCSYAEAFSLSGRPEMACRALIVLDDAMM